jgi:lysophospholipase L1-like esterase
MNPLFRPLPLLCLLSACGAVSLDAQNAPTPVPGNFDAPSAANPGAQAKPRSPRPQINVHSPRDDKAGWAPTDFALANPKLPTLVIAGDSTASTGDPAHRGWGAPLVDYFDTTRMNVINRAVGGRSFRTFYREGLWQKIVDALKPGDFVVIEFGHNDGGPVDSGPARGDLPGTGDDTKEVTNRDGQKEIVHSFGWYARKFIRDTRAKGATPILSTTTVRNLWTNPRAKFKDAALLEKQEGYNPAEDRVERGMGGMLEWAGQVAAEEKTALLDHSNITADFFEKIGREQTAKYFPADHTHTSTEGAIVNAETFIAGLKLLDQPVLLSALNEKGRSISPYRAETKH